MLAHWTYTPDEWNKYAEKEYVTERKVKRVLFYVIAGFALFFGVLFFIIDRESGVWVLVMMLVLIGIIAFTAWFTSWYNYRQNKKYLGETYITRESVYMNRQLHTWHGLGARLASVNLDKEKEQQILELTYTAPTRTGLQDYTVRVPVPKGKEKEAAKVLEKFRE